MQMVTTMMTTKKEGHQTFRQWRRDEMAKVSIPALLFSHFQSCLKCQQHLMLGEPSG